MADAAIASKGAIAERDILAGGRTIGEVFQAVKAGLAAAGIETAGLDARALVCAAAGLDHAGFIRDRDAAIDDAGRRRLEAIFMRRRGCEPLALILGVKEFWSRDFAVSAETLVPRPDTETLVAAALDAIDARLADSAAPVRLLDLGTGSGCILVTLLAERERTLGLGVDISAGALKLARANAAAHGVAARARFVAGSWFAAISGQYDVIVVNPPYIKTMDMAALAPEIARFEPAMALDGGVDGLDAYRRIGEGARTFLAPGGTLVTEVGHGQARDVAAIFARAGLAVSEDASGRLCDLAGIERCVRAGTM